MDSPGTYLVRRLYVQLGCFLAVVAGIGRGEQHVTVLAGLMALTNALLVLRALRHG